MNILIFSWRGIGHPAAGGAEIVTFEYAKGWTKAGNQVTIFTSEYNNGLSKVKVEGVTIIRRGGPEIGVRIRAIWWYLFECKTNYDLVIDEFHGIPFFTPLFVKAPKLAFIHEVAKEVWFLNFNYLKATFGYIIEPLVIRFLYGSIPFMTVSNSTAKDLIKFGIKKNNITVINNGVDILHPKKQIKKEQTPTIIYLGALSKDKGIEDAIRAFALITKYSDKIHLWVVGKGEKEYINYLKHLIKELEIKHAKFWGYVSQEKKFELLTKSHLLLFPSIREGWGLVVIEAAAMGVPTIGYKVSGLKDSVVDGKTGILSNVQDIEGLSNSVIYLLKNKSIYNLFAKNSKIRSLKFTWDESLRKSFKLLNKVTQTYKRSL